MRTSAVGLILVFAPVTAAADQPTGKGNATMTKEQAAVFARLALKGIHKEYLNKPGDAVPRR